jgi:hypothetical protein
VKRVLVALLLVPLAATALFGLLNWVFRRRGSSFPLVASVLSQWLVAYLVWALLGALVESSGLFEGRVSYTKYGFGLFAVIFGLWQYRLARAGETRQASRVFMWSQIGWLLLVLAERGVLG